MPTGKKSNAGAQAKANASATRTSNNKRKRTASEQKRADVNKAARDKKRTASKPKTTKMKQMDNKRAFSKGGAADKKQKSGGTVTRGASGARKAYPSKKK